jgi:glycosyltransferase involved in cell wall biosynthesis
MCRELRRNGFNARILVPKQEALSKRLRFMLLKSQAPSWLKEGLEVCTFFRGDLSSVEMSTDEICIGVGTGGAILVQSLPRSIKTVRYCHGFSEHLLEPSKIAWSGDIPVILVSPFLLDKLQAHGSTNVLGVVPNGYRTDEFFLENPLDDPSRSAIGTIYNSNAKKAPEDTLKVLRLIEEQRPEIPLVMYGSNRRPGCSNRVEYRRFPSAKKLRDMYNQSRVWFISSRSEGFCLPILEAMACGAAVVSTDHDTVRGLVEPGINGELVPVGDPEAIARTSIELWADDQKRLQISRNAQRCTSEYNWTSAAESMVSVLQRL